MSTVITSEELKDHLRDNIAFYLKKKGMTTYRLAKITDEPLNTMYRIVGGKNEPGATLLLRIAEALDVSVEDLISEKPRISRNSA